MINWIKTFIEKHIVSDFDKQHNPYCFDCNEADCKGACPARKIAFAQDMGTFDAGCVERYYR